VLVAFRRSEHKSNVVKHGYHWDGIGPFTRSSKPDISPDRTWRLPMKTIILAAFTALSLGIGVANATSVALGAVSGAHQAVPTVSAFDAGWGNG
jgi:hypothetical protein